MTPERFEDLRAKNSAYRDSVGPLTMFETQELIDEIDNVLALLKATFRCTPREVERLLAEHKP
jgi:hypothetical protein